MSENENKDTIYKRLIRPSISIPCALLALGYVSTQIWKKSYLIQNLRTFRNYIERSVLPFLNSTKKCNSQKLVYIHGKIKQTSIQPILDPIFGVQSSQNTRGLYRKYELYCELEHNKYDWININQLKSFKIPEQQRLFKSQVLTSSDMVVNNHVLDQPLLQELAEQNSDKLKINPIEIDKHFEQIRKNFQELSKNNLNELISNPNTEMYDKHPFKYAISQYKDIYYEDNYIYICNKYNKFSDYDMRISLHEIQKVVDVTVLAQNRDNTLNQFEIPEILDKNVYVEITNSSGQKQQKSLGLVQFIQKGFAEYTDMLQKLFTVSIQQTNWALLYALALYIIYKYMYEQIGPALDPQNWGEKAMIRLAQECVSMEGDQCVVEYPHFSTFKYALLSSTSHILCSYMFAAGSGLSFIIGGPLIYFQFLAIANKIQLEMKIKGEIQNKKTYYKHFKDQQYKQENNLFQKYDL